MSSRFAMTGIHAMIPPLAAAGAAAAPAAAGAAAAGAAPGDSIRFAAIVDQLLRGLSFEIDEFLEDFVAGGDHARAGLEGALADDQLGEFICQIHVGKFQRAGFKFSEAVGSRCAWRR